MATEMLSSSRSIRDQIGDHLITPRNSALVVISYQPSQLAGVQSMDRDLLLKNVVSTVKVGNLFGVLREGYEVCPVVDAIGGTSVEAHRAGLERVVQAGATPVTWVSLACELQRDWGRLETVQEIVQIVLTERLLKE